MGVQTIVVEFWCGTNMTLLPFIMKKFYAALFAEWLVHTIILCPQTACWLVLDGVLISSVIMALLTFHIMLFLESVNRERRSFEGAKRLHWWFVGSFD